jgi:hypothetical protein
MDSSVRGAVAQNTNRWDAKHRFVVGRPLHDRGPGEGEGIELKQILQPAGDGLLGIVGVQLTILTPTLLVVAPTALKSHRFPGGSVIRSIRLPVQRAPRQARRVSRRAGAVQCRGVGTRV